MYIKAYSKYWDGLYFDHVLRTKSEPRGFDPRRNHAHDNRYELYYLHYGDVTEIIEDRKYKLKPRDLVLIKPNNHHCITVDSAAAYEHFVIVFDPQVLGIDNMRYWPDAVVINCQKLPAITEIFRKLDHYYSMIQTDELRDAVSLLIKELLYNLGYGVAPKDTDHSESTNPLIVKALAQINANLFTISNVDEIAQSLFVTRGYLYRIFTKELHTTPLKYITEKRLDAARNMILQGESPTRVYSQCGFNDYTTFYRNYIKAFGQPPSK